MILTVLTQKLLHPRHIKKNDSVLHCVAAVCMYIQDIVHCLRQSACMYKYKYIGKYPMTVNFAI